MPNHPDNTLFTLATKLGAMLSNKHYKLATAESCTGGWVAQTVTNIPGSSAWFDRGFITYSNQAKQEMLGVKKKTLQTYGAVSQQTALEMAKGALLNSHTDISIAITGIAGPDGGLIDKPVGTVWIGYAITNAAYAHCWHFNGDRYLIRKKSVNAALEMLINFLQSHHE